jgi:DNA-binding protein Alba
MSEENVIYIGRKPVMNYCLAVLTSLQDGTDRVSVQARGNNISKAVDVAEIVRNRYMEDLKVESIEIGTDELEADEGGTRNVSKISIVLKK